MTEYIEREAAKKEFNLNFGSVSHAVIANRILDSIPAADVAPVVHGRWVERKRWAYGKWSKWIECSECGHADYNADMYEDMPFTSPGNYCPNCGARMDGE